MLIYIRSMLLILIISLIAPVAYSNDYYSEARGLDGMVLQNTLHGIIDDHTPIPYTNSDNTDWMDGVNIDVWEALVIIDSACLQACGQILTLYLEDVRDMSLANKGAGGSGSWEREHVWAKVRGFPKTGQDGYSDLHHIYPADRNINAKRSYYGFGNAADSPGVAVTDTTADGTIVPTNLKLDKVLSRFEPHGITKGRVARAIFYMATRYGPGDDGYWEKMPDLKMRTINMRVKEPWMGGLCTLLDWNRKWGPDDYERRRNDLIEEIQGNRNPFIDEPGFAHLIWSDLCP